jgi:predicted NBD/HSP70 family sugar kinase
VVDAPGSLESLRRLNRLRVLETVQHRGAASRVDIVRSTGLSRTTVSSLVAQLLAEDVLIERPDRQPQPAVPNVGRPPTLLSLNPTGGGVLGIHFGHDSVRIAVTDLSCTVLDEAAGELPVGYQARDVFDDVADTALDLVRRCGLTVDRVIGLGVAVSTPVNAGAQALRVPAVLTGWDDVDLVAEWRARLPLPVFVGNDANLGAVAEWTFGAGRGVDDFVYVMLSDGVGAGLVLNGLLYEGASGTAGEIGHVVVARDGFVCRCGSRGCLETVAGAGALISAFSHSMGPGTTLDAVLSLARDGDPGAVRLIEDAGRAVGRALSGICTVLDPRLVIVGGKTSAAGEPLLAGIRAALAREVSPSVNRTVRVVGGELGARAEVLGAIALANRNTAVHLLPGQDSPSATRRSNGAIR